MLENWRDKNRLIIQCIGITAIVVVLWLFAWGIIHITISDWASRGQFGDMFGSINSLFSGLAFAGVIFTIYMQKEELELQRKELQFTREELKRTADAQERTEQALAKQVELQYSAARLDALSSLIENCKVRINSPGLDPLESIEIRDMQVRYADLLQEEIQDFIES